MNSDIFELARRIKTIPRYWIPEWKVISNGLSQSKLFQGTECRRENWTLVDRGSFVDAKKSLIWRLFVFCRWTTMVLFVVVSSEESVEQCQQQQGNSERNSVSCWSKIWSLSRGENHWKGLTEQQDRDASPTVANGIIKGAGYCECRIKRNAHNL
jgi:hypothetical protein